MSTQRRPPSKDHRYPDLADALTYAHNQVDTWFEAATAVIHAGHRHTPRQLLDADPALVRVRSPFPDRQTLLHHVAANGIEVERQLHSPTNAVDILKLV